MDASSVSVLWYRKSKPLGKVRRRVQDLRIPSSSYNELARRPTLDLSHNESTRLAADSLLSRGLEGYHEVLNAEGEVDFLSELEKTYILENGRDGSAADPGASDDDDDDDDKEIDSLSVGSQCATRCPALSTDSDPIVAGLDLSSQTDVKLTDPVPDEPNFEVYFQFDSRAASMKDLVREFIRKATMALAIVMDSFTDVELLCDLLEVSRKRNVSVHLLLDHLNLNLFVSTWQDLKLNSKDFPKLSVRSVDGQTYCAKTGRKLTGQTAESFIITDWTEVLTGSYSFSWLSWQVHRSLAVLVKGSAVIPFHQEFQRLHSSSKPVPGFVSYITVPRTLPFDTTLHAAQSDNADVSKSKSSQTKTMCHRAWNEDAQNTQTKAKMAVLSNLQTAELECSKGNTQPLHGETHKNPPQLNPKPLVPPGALQIVSVQEPKHTVRADCTQYDARTTVEPLEKNQNQIQSHSNPLSQTPVSYLQSQLTSLTITTAAEKNARMQNTQTKAKMAVLSNLQTAELECSKSNTQPLHRETHENPPQLNPKPLVQLRALQIVSVQQPKHTVGADCTQYDARTTVKPLEKNQNQIQSRSNPLSQTPVSYLQSQLTSLAITTAAEKNARVQESNPLRTASPTRGQHRTVCYQSAFRTNSNLEHHNVGTEGLFFQLRNRDRLTKPSGIPAVQNTRIRQWNCSLNFKPKVDFLVDSPKVLSPSTPQQKQANTGPQFPLTHPRGHTSGLQTNVSSLGTSRQDQPQRHHQPRLQSHPTPEAPPKSASTATGSPLKPQLQSDTKLHLQPPPRLNWMPQSHAARPRPVARHSSFGATYGTGQQTGGQVGRRPFHSSMNTSIGRSVTDKTLGRP